MLTWLYTCWNVWSITIPFQHGSRVGLRSWVISRGRVSGPLVEIKSLVSSWGRVSILKLRSGPESGVGSYARVWVSSLVQGVGSRVSSWGWILGPEPGSNIRFRAGAGSRVMSQGRVSIRGSTSKPRLGLGSQAEVGSRIPSRGSGLRSWTGVESQVPSRIVG